MRKEIPRKLSSGISTPKLFFVLPVEMTDTDALHMYEIHIGKDYPGQQEAAHSQHGTLPHPLAFKPAEANISERK